MLPCATVVLWGKDEFKIFQHYMYFFSDKAAAVLMSDPLIALVLSTEPKALGELIGQAVGSHKSASTFSNNISSELAAPMWSFHGVGEQKFVHNVRVTKMTTMPIYDKNL